MKPLIIKGAFEGTTDGSMSEVAVICRDGNEKGLDRIHVKLGTDVSVVLPRDTEMISIIPIIDLDI